MFTTSIISLVFLFLPFAESCCTSIAFVVNHSTEVIMDEELLKRNTDCVYFLASPFTCKKGADCEYRHSEMARLNPRDCWYWLSGSCLNPTCGFRHPPMDTSAETSAQAEPFHNNTSLPPSKNNVPCYFYFNGYCGKGDKCTFLHGTQDTSAEKLKIDSASTGAPTLGSKSPFKASVPKITAEKPDAKVSSPLMDTNRRARMTDDKVCPMKEPVQDLPEVALNTDDEVSLYQKMQIQSSDTYTILEQKTLQHSIASEFEKSAMSKLASLNPPENMDKSDPSEYSDQSTEDQIDKDVVRDEWWESSPGFDVLVEGKSEGMTYGAEQEFMHGYNDLYDGNVEEHGDRFLDYRYRDLSEYGDRFLCENRIREASYYSDDDERFDDLNDYYHGDRGMNHIMPQKRKFPTIGLPIGGHHYNGDLREHLGKRRFHEERDAFRHPNFPSYTQERQREPRRSSNQRLNGRMTSNLERNGVNLTAQKSAFAVPDQRGRARNKELTTRHHHHHERKRLQNSSRVQRRPFSRQKRESNNNISFAPPKTLAQIKEEKDRARCDVSLSSEIRRSSQISSVGFDGTKHLTEILQVKRRVNPGGEEDVSIIF
ncbi:hypothetical protein V2J09_002872 [Rumex salicifolius]